jgi:hypothetical protein
MKTACIEAALHWASRDARHCERVHLPALAIDPEGLPVALTQWLPHAATGEMHRLALAPGELAGTHDVARVLTLAPEKLRCPLVDGLRLVPRVGRYYPRARTHCPAAASTVSPPFAACTALPNGIKVDLNHPLAGVSATLEVTMLGTGSGGEVPASNLVEALIADGPGMQAALAPPETSTTLVPFRHENQTSSTDSQQV